MKRIFALLLAVAIAAAAEYAPQVDQVRFYAWRTTQAVSWNSAGDALRFSSEITWKLALRCAAVEGGRMRLKATFITVTASHRGPGVEVSLDSATGAGGDDQLLGHLLALVGKTLDLEVDRATGAVASVTGGEALIAAINQRAPPAVPGDPPPLDAGARAAYGPEALARLWSQILALPGASSTVALPPPFAAGSTIERTWKDLAWTVALPKDAAPAFELARDPTPVRGTVKGLSGSGTNSLAGGLPGRCEGRLAFTMVFDALTQAVDSQHELTWELRPIE